MKDIAILWEKFRSLKKNNYTQRKPEILAQAKTVRDKSIEHLLWSNELVIAVELKMVREELDGAIKLLRQALKGLEENVGRERFIYDCSIFLKPFGEEEKDATP